MATTSLILKPGDELGGYRIDDVLGIGGMAVVYRAEQLSLGRPVALKVLSPELSRDPVFRERFRREGQHVAALEHPNIIPVFDASEDDGRLFLATRLVDGETLAQRMLERGLGADETLAILAPIADALDVAHRAGVIHRDVKPQNILLTATGHPFLADFGVAKSSHGHGLTASGSFLGSVSYASPEQIRGERLEPASDLYSLTAVLFQCLTGQVPYPRDTDAGVMHAHLSEPPPSLPASAGALQDVVARGMAKQPERRHDSARELIADVERALVGLPTLQRGAVPAFPVTRAPEPPTGRSGPELTIAVDATAHDQRREVPEQRVEVERSSHAGRWIGGAVAIATASIVAALLLTPAGAPADPATTSAGGLTVAVRAPWVTQPATAPPIDGVALQHPVALSTIGAAGETAVLRAGPFAREGAQAGDLPPAVAKAFRATPKVETVRAGGQLARRHSGRTADGAALTVLVIPTARTDLAAACRMPSDTDPALCATVLASVRLTDGTAAIPPGPDLALAKRLASALGPVAAARPARGVSAADLQTRAATARRIAAADRRAARDLASATPSRHDAAALRALRAALTAHAAQLQRLATATTKRDRAAYAARAAGVRAADRRLRRALTDLRRLGYPLDRSIRP